MANTITTLDGRNRYTGVDVPTGEAVFCEACETACRPENVGGGELGAFGWSESLWVSDCCEAPMTEIVGCYQCGENVETGKPVTDGNGHYLCSDCGKLSGVEVSFAAETIRRAADRCLAEWDAHFGRYYTRELPGDREKRAGVRMGIESLRDDMIRVINERREGGGI